MEKAGFQDIEHLGATGVSTSQFSGGSLFRATKK
jgi:hypothetical protein